MKQKIFFFTHFPPPVHGFSSVNKFIYDKLIENGSFEIVKFSFIKKSDSRFIFYINRVIRSLNSLYLILKNYRSARNSIFYMPVSGGFGMAFEILPWLLAGLIFKKRIMHHHSFQYCYKYSVLMNIMQMFQKKGTYNIFLCKCHLKKFNDQYPIVINNVSIISNEMTLSRDYIKTPLRRKPFKKDDIVVGHLSNLSVEKGFLVFCELVEKLGADGNIKFELAGPTTDPEILLVIEKLTTKFPETFTYRGSIYNTEKMLWYRSLDFFIFPSSYNNETYPLVVSEAILSDVIPLSTAIGCLPEFNHKDFTFSIETFVDNVLAILINTSNDETHYENLKSNLLLVKEQALEKSEKDIRKLIDLFI